MVVDKTSGRTSHDEVEALREIYGLRRVGHSGTLDPEVTGVLVCGLGWGTKVLPYILRSEKVYEGELLLHGTVSREALDKALKHFTGAIRQRPPQKSRVVRRLRTREVSSLEMLEWDPRGRRALLRCRVEKGTYIRKLFHDLGVYLGVGAQMGRLRRLQAGPFTLKNAPVVTTQTLRGWQAKAQGGWRAWWYLWRLESCLLPLERALEGLPHLVVDEGARGAVASGSPVYIPGVRSFPPGLRVGDEVAVGDGKRVWALGRLEISGEDLAHKREGTAVSLRRVLL